MAGHIRPTGLEFDTCGLNDQEDVHYKFILVGGGGSATAIPSERRVSRQTSRNRNKFLTINKLQFQASAITTARQI